MHSKQGNREGKNRKQQRAKCTGAAHLGRNRGYNLGFCLATLLQAQQVVLTQKEYACVITKSFC